MYCIAALRGGLKAAGNAKSSEIIVRSVERGSTSGLRVSGFQQELQDGYLSQNAQVEVGYFTQSGSGGRSQLCEQQCTVS